MNYPDEHAGELPFFIKALLIFVVGLFVIIGLIGLILPIIPGILFLALAALLMSKVSSRFAFFLEHNDSWNKIRRYWRSISFLSIAQQLKLTALVVARSVVDAVDALIEFIKKKI